MESKTCVIWTVNLDKRKSRNEGRRIPKRFSVPNVKLHELIEACKKLGIECVAENKKYPKCWWEDTGRVIIPKKESKTKIMIKIAQKILELREQKAIEKLKEKKKKKRK